MIGSLFEFGTEAMRRIWPDATDSERAKQTLWLAELEQAHRERLAQVEINVAQAQHPSLFVSGPRPALMWVCVLGFALHYIAYPAWVAVATLAGWPIPPEPPTNPVLWELTLGMLGLAGFRSFEKAKGVARER
jgi:hypothetical protein